MNRVLEEIRARLDFIGVDWINEESSDDEERKESAKNAAPKKQVRLLDYACGTGLGKYFILYSWVREGRGQVWAGVVRGLVNKHHTDANIRRS